MITVHSLPRGFGLSSLSPFCAKLEVFLTMAGLPFRSIAADMRKAPKGKVPFISDDDGTVIADSSVIIDHLIRKHRLAMDDGLDADARARGHLVRRVFEDSLYFVGLWQNWIVEENFAHLRPFIEASVPTLLRPFAPSLIRGAVKKQLQAQGIGRHAPAEIAAHAIADLDAVATVLGDRPFLLGDAPTSVDATAYAFLAWLVKPPMTSRASEHARANAAFRAYLARMEQRFDLGAIPGAAPARS